MRRIGYLQRYVFVTIVRHGKPITFAELRDVTLKAMDAPEGDVLLPAYERSLRRALHSLVQAEGVVTIGEGRNGNPFRYSINPVLLVRDRERRDANITEEAT